MQELKRTKYQKAQSFLQQFSLGTVDAEGVFQPPTREIGNENFRVVPDVRSLYAFFGDVTLFLFIALGIYFSIDRWAAGQEALQQFQMMMRLIPS